MLSHWGKDLSRSGGYLLPVSVNDHHQRAAWQAPSSGLTVFYSHGSVGSLEDGGARLCFSGWFGLAEHVCHLSQNQWAGLRIFSWLWQRLKRSSQITQRLSALPQHHIFLYPRDLKDNNKRPHGWTHSQGVGKTVDIFNNSHTLWKMLTTHIEVITGLTHMC